MQVHKINNNNVTFGKIILNCRYPIEQEIPASSLLKELPVKSLINNRIIAEELYTHPGYLLDIKAILDKSDSVKEKPELQFLRGTLSEVLVHDYLVDNNPYLLKKFERLVLEQEDNPHDIHLDVFPEDEGEIPLESYRWYQKAIVGDKVFKQRIYAFQGSAIKFLKDACRYADKLRDKDVDPEETDTETAISAAEDQPEKFSLIKQFEAVMRHFNKP